MKMDKTFKGILKYLDGSQDEIDVPGALDSNGTYYVPENVTFYDTHFILNPGVRGEDWFEYLEVRPSNKPAPFRSDLH